MAVNSDNAPLVVHIIYALKSGGLENGLVNIINRSPRDRYRHAIVCLTDADEFANRITAPDVQVIQLHKKPGNDLKLYWRLWCVLRQLKPAIVHTRNFNSLEMQFLTFWLPGVKRVHGEHGRDLNDLDGSNKKYNVFRKFMRRFVHHYIAVSKDLGLWLQQTINVPGQRVSQIYNGVDVDKFSTKIETLPQLLPERISGSNVIVIGTVGRLAGVKNQRSLINAFSMCQVNHPDLKPKLRLLIVGDGPMRTELQQTVDNLSLHDVVWMAGERSDIADLMAQMDVFVLPSLAEGVSNTVLEAMASGLPIIATNVGGNPELVSPGINGLLVPVDDDQALAKAIVKLASEKQLCDDMGSNSRKRIEDNFNWNKTVNQYLEIYDKVRACRQ